MTIQQAIESKKLPKNISKSQWRKICDSIGIKFQQNQNILELEITEEQLKRLQYSKDVHVANVSNIMTASHNSVVANYDKLIMDYKALSDEMSTKPYLASEKKKIDELIGNLLQAKGKYQGFMSGFEISDKKVRSVEELKNAGSTTYFMEDDKSISAQISQSRSAKLDGKIGALDEKLQSAYAKLESIQSVTYHFKFKQYGQNLRSQIMLNRISNLRAKQGMLEDKQTQIIGIQTQKYLEKMAKKHEKAARELEKQQQHQMKMDEFEKTRNGYLKDYDITQQQLKNLENKTGVIAKVQRTALKMESRAMSAVINRLGKKLGYTNLQEQVCVQRQQGIKK